MRPASLFLLSLALAGGPALASVSVTFRQGVSPAGYTGAKDVYLTDGAGTPWNPNVNYDGFGLEVEGSTNKSAALLRWDLSTIPTTATVNSVTLTLDVGNGSSGTYHLYECLRPWVETQATWNQYATGLSWGTPGANNTTTSPDRGATALDLDPLTGTTGLRTFRLNASGVAVVQNWVATPSANHGFVVPSATSSDGFGWTESETSTSANRPRLNVTYTPLSGTTTTLTFQEGVSPSSSYAGTTDVVLGNQPDPRTVNQDGNGLVVDSNPEFYVALIGFDLSSIPPWATVNQATLTFNVTNTSNGSFFAYEVLQPWEQTTATWNQARAGSPWATPGAQGATDYGATVLGTFQPAALGAQSIALNAAGVAVVQGWVSGARANNGFVVFNAANTNGVDLDDSEDATPSARPGFTVDYTEGQLALSSAGASSGPEALTVQRQRLNGSPIDTGAPALDVTFSTSSATGGFSTSNLPNATTSPTLTVQIPAGASQSPTVYYWDSTPGTASVSGTAGAAWNDATLGVVTPEPDAGVDAGTDAGTDAGQAEDGGTGADAGEPQDAGPVADAGEPPDAGLPSLQLRVGCGVSNSAPAVGVLALGLISAAAWLRRRRR